jgi:prepilin-type N-terminal cleavage/methylation domain-containing protein
MKKNQLKKAFTLVELIVVIVILAILWTVAYIYIINYNTNARDTVRITDIKSIRKTLDVYFYKEWNYPDPTDWVDVTYSWATAWTQWVFWVETRKKTWMISTIPLDPLTGNPYAYSVTNQKVEYQLWAALELKESQKNDLEWMLINKVYASEDTLATYIIWNYNWKIVKVSTWWLDYIITTPTIIASDLSNTDILQILDNKRLSYSNFSNLPHSYSWVTSNNDNIFDFSWWNNIVFKGSFQELYSSKKAKMELYERIAKRYNDSFLEWKGEYKIFSDTYSDSLNPTTQYINYTCFVIWDLLKDDKNKSCLDTKDDILVWEAYTWALLPNWETNYVWQWPLWDVYNYWQWIQTANHDRSNLWLKWWLNKTIWIKWKLFTKAKNATNYFGGLDINWDSKENMLYWFWWKLIMWDIETWKIVWQTKILDIKKVLWIEDIMWDWSKSIIVALWEDRWIWVINWKTWELDWISNKVSWTVKKVKIGWPWINYKTFDINWDWIKEYHFKQRYKKYHSMRFFKSWSKVIWETLWSSEWFGNYNENVSDWYQPYVWSMGNIQGKLVVAAKWANTFSFYSNNVDSSLSAPDKFKMPAFAKLITWWDSYHWRSRSLWYFYDINWDWNDEYIARIDKELNNNKHSRIIVAWLDASWNMKQYMSLATINPSSPNYTTPIALKNYSDLGNSYILTYWEDPNTQTNKWLLLKYNWLNSSAYKKDSDENESFNYKIEYDKFDSSYTPVWIFNNGNKDYIVLRKWSYYYFYTFNWVNTFKAPLSESSLKVSWSFFGNTLFDNGYDINREKGKDSWVFLAWYDTNNNWIKEFVVAEWWWFKLYEITNSWVNLIKTFNWYSSVPSRQKYWLTSDKKDMYIISYNSSKNTVNYYRTDFDNWITNFRKITNDTFYSGWQTNDMVISKLAWFNRLMIKWLWMFDARNANPTTPPIKISNEFFYSYDMDRDWENEIFKSWKAYTYNWPWNYTLKYNWEWWQWDIDWDWVLDNSWSICRASANFPVNLFYTIRSWKDNSQIIPDLDWGNWNWRCAWWNKYSWVSEDFDWDWKDDFVIWTQARAHRVLSLSWSKEDWFTINEWAQVTRNSNMLLSAFDFDWDWIKEIIRWYDDDLKIWKIDENDKTKLNLLFEITTKQIKKTHRQDIWIPALYRNEKSWKVYIAIRWIDWEVALYTWKADEWVKFLWKNYYIYAKKYSSDTQVLNNNLIPIATADVLLWDFMHEWNDPQVLIWSGDWYVYLIWVDWYIRRWFYIWSSIKRMIIWDTNEDLLLDIIVWAEDWYVYQISSSRLDPPSIVRDWLVWDYDKQTEEQKAEINFYKVNEAKWYQIQLYNYTKKQAVFDFIDIWNKTSACVVSNNYSWDIWDCIKINTNFSLERNVIYVWRVQAYNDEMFSPEALSDWFYIE